MPSWKPRVEVDTARQQRQLDQLGVARPGPTSYGPLDGHIRLHDGTNDTGYLNFDGFQVRFRGALSGLTPHLEANATKNEQQDGRLTGHDNDVSRIDAKNTAQDGRLDGHDSTLSSHASTLSSHDTRITNEVAARQSADNTLHGRVTTETNQRKDADSALSGRISTARSRADSAHDRIDGLNFASPNELAALEGRIASVESHIGVIDSWLRQHTGYPSGGLNPGA